MKVVDTFAPEFFKRVVDGAAGILPSDTEIAMLLRRAGKKVILVVNKIDSEGRVSLVGEFYKLGLGEPVPVSALMGIRSGDLLDIVTAGFENQTSGP